MKQIGFIAAALLASSALLAENVDINGDFQKITKWKTADGWLNTDSRGRAEVIREGNRNAVRITLRENSGFNTFRRMKSVPVHAADRVTVRMTASGKGILGCGVAWTKKGVYAENDQKWFHLTPEPKEYVFSGALGGRGEKGMDGFIVTAILIPEKPGEKDVFLKLDSVTLDVTSSR